MDPKNEARLESFAVALLFKLIELLGPALVRKKVDEFEAARASSNAAFESKFGEKP